MVIYVNRQALLSRIALKRSAKYSGGERISQRFESSIEWKHTDYRRRSTGHRRDGTKLLDGSGNGIDVPFITQEGNRLSMMLPR